MDLQISEHGMINGAKNMVPIAVATGVAGIVVGSVTLTGIGLILAEVIEELSGGNIIAVLILTAIVSLILGMGLPTTAKLYSHGSTNCTSDYGFGFKSRLCDTCPLQLTYLCSTSEY